MLPKKMLPKKALPKKALPKKEKKHTKLLENNLANFGQGNLVSLDDLF
jgi:hypothetical protein